MVRYERNSMKNQGYIPDLVNTRTKREKEPEIRFRKEKGQ